MNFFDGMAQNVAGLDARLSPDLRDDDIAQFLGRRRRLERVAIRHTVGLDDQVEGEGGVADARRIAAPVISSSSSTAIPRRMLRA